MRGPAWSILYMCWYRCRALLEQRILHERRNDRNHLEPDGPALAVVLGLHESVVDLERELERQLADLEELAGAEADRQRQLVAGLRLPVHLDVRRHADLPAAGNQVEEEVLEIHGAGGRPVVLSRERPPLVQQSAEDPFLPQIESERRRPGLPLACAERVAGGGREDEGRPYAPEDSAAFRGRQKAREAQVAEAAVLLEATASGRIG